MSWICSIFSIFFFENLERIEERLCHARIRSRVSLWQPREDKKLIYGGLFIRIISESSLIVEAIFEINKITAPSAIEKSSIQLP